MDIMKPNNTSIIIIIFVSFFSFFFLAHAHFLLRTCKEDMSRGGWEGSFRKLEEENLAPWLRRAHWRFENKVFDINTNLCPNIATCNETTSNLLLPWWRTESHLYGLKSREIHQVHCTIKRKKLQLYLDKIRPG